MTLDEFLDDYVPRVLKPMGGWRVGSDGGIRRGESCPLTAESERSACYFPGEGKRLGLPGAVPGDIAIAADFSDVKKVQPVRARLLAGLGLVEAARGEG